MRRIFFLARAEVLHIVRDRTTMMQILVLPVVQLLILVNAATFIIRNTPMAVVDHDRTSTSRGLINRFAASGNFDVERAASEAAANDKLLDGKVTMVLVIPRDFEASLVRERMAPVQIVLNAEKGSAAGIVQSYAQRIFATYSASLGAELRPNIRNVTNVPRRGDARLEVRARGWYNPSLNYKHYMVPGVLVALVTLIGTLLAAQNIAREKELGTLEQLNVTPITRGQFIAAKLIPLWFLGLIDLTIGLVVGKLVFDIPMRGSLLLLFGAAAIYLLVALGVGLLVSTLVETQQQAMFVTFFIMSAYLLLSGLFTPIDSMAPWVKTVSLLNPVRHFVSISRAILVKAAGPAEIAQPMLYLTVFAVVILSLAVMRYRKTTA
ncbi:MAG TPA: ABC transporter permease [Thermoanaerobaculia bacterium]